MAKLLIETGAILNVRNQKGKLPSKQQMLEGSTTMTIWLKLMEEEERAKNEK